MTLDEAIKVYEEAYYNATVDIINALEDIVTRNEASHEYPEQSLFAIVNALTDIVMSDGVRNVHEKAMRAVDEQMKDL